MEKHSVPPTYWWGWGHGSYAGSVREVEDEPEDTALPEGVPSSDVDAVSEMEESAFVTTKMIPIDSSSPPSMDYPDMEDFGDVSEEIRDAIVEIYEDIYDDPSMYRRQRFDIYRKDILKRLQTAELLEPVLEAQRRREVLKFGATLSEEHRMDWEKTIEETVGLEVPERERFVAKYFPPGPPPGPVAKGRGAFFIAVDGSGSMFNVCDHERDANRFEVSSAIVWTFIQEARAINRSGRSHYLGIYGFDGCMYYPLPVSDYPPQPPLNPLPCENIFRVEKDFLRYWPEPSLSVGFHGQTNWEYTLPAVYDDYVTFGGGDLIIIADGDADSETAFITGPEAHDVFSGKDIDLPEDPDNPSILMKLQDYMRRNDCGTGYLFWIVEPFEPDFVCPECGTDDIEFTGLSGQVYNYRCAKGHTWTGAIDETCPRTGCPVACKDCRYFHLVLGDLFDGGRHIFKGTSADRLLDNVAGAIAGQRKKRLDRGAMDEVSFQEDEV